MSDTNSQTGLTEKELSAEQVKQRIIQWSPSLDKLNTQGQTLQDYFAPMAQWGRSDIYPLQSRALDLIQDRTERLHGKDVAEKLRHQLQDHPIAESGTHISFPRDYDAAGHITYDNDLVWQGALLSASLYRNAGMNIHFGFYSSRVPVRNTNSAEFLQLAAKSAGTRMLSSKKANNIVMHAPVIEQSKIQEIRIEYENHFIKARAEQAQNLLKQPSGMTNERRHTWGEFLAKNIIYTQRNDYTMQKIESDLTDEGFAIKSYANDLQFTHGILDAMANPLAVSSTNFGFSDQVMAVQTRLLNKMLPEDTSQVVVDFTEISIKLMAESLRDKNSVWHKTFADPAARDAFVHGMAGIRTGWDADPATGAMQSPFVIMQDSKGSLKPTKVDYDIVRNDLTPENIADQLERGKIMPTTALEVGFMLTETGIAFHGGMFQAIYAPDIQAKFAGHLRNFGETERAASLESMPLDIATQSPCFGVANENGNNRLLRFSDFMENRVSIAEAERIPSLQTKSAIGVASPTLHNFFTYYEPHLTANISEIVSDKAAQNIYAAFTNDQNLVTRTSNARVTHTVTATAYKI